VLVRVDFNVPMENGEVTDATRIERAAPTIREIADKGGKVILLSHLGRPKRPDPKYSLRPVAAEVARIVKRPVAFAEDCVGPKAEAAVAAMKNGDILCLENTRFHPEEEKNDKAFAKKLATLGDIFVEEAFSAAHREHASIAAIVTASKIPAYPGRAMKAELDALERAFEKPERPVAAIVGGAKVSTKLNLLGHLLAKVETLMIGGGMANTFLAAQGKLSASRSMNPTSCRRRAISSPRRSRSIAKWCCRWMGSLRKSSPRTLLRASCRWTRSAPPI
jgi:phosphoglycerate kinase